MSKDWRVAILQPVWIRYLHEMRKLSGVYICCGVDMQIQV